jgi:hypothetical protein
MVSEKDLVRAMKEAWKGREGYTVAVFEKGWFLSAEKWSVFIPSGLLPRKSLALVVEHIGEIPKIAQAYTCTKRGGAQMATAAMLEGEAQELLRVGNINRAERTQLKHGEYALWQNADTLRVIAIDENYSDIAGVQMRQCAFCSGDCMYFCLKGVVLKVHGEYIGSVVRDYLSAMQWCGNAEG